MSDDKMWGGNFTRRSFLRVFGLATAPLVLGGVSGCRPTDTLTNKVYADWSTDIDHDSPMKSLVNKPNKEPTTSLPKLYKTESEAVEQEVQTPQVEDDSPSQDGQLTPEAKHSDKAEKDEKVKKGSKKKAKKKEEEEQEKEDEIDTAGKERVRVGDNKGKIGKDASKDATDVPERQSSLIAFGEVANVVLMLGGKGALWAADGEFLKAAKSLYPKSTVSSVHDGFWDDYSEDSQTLTKKQFKQLCAALDEVDESARPAYLIYDGSVGCPITDSEASTLKSLYKVDVRYFYFTNPEKLKNTISWIMKALDGASGIEKDPSAQSKAYWEFHDGLLKEITDLNGGIGAWTNATESGRENWDFSTGKKTKDSVVSQSDLMWTLVIEDWDKGARFNNKNAVSSLESRYGLGMCTLSYDWSPVNCYLQRAGVLNNAAARYQTHGWPGAYQRYVWQFAMVGSQQSTRLSTKTVSGGKLTSTLDQLNGGTDDILLRAMDSSCGLGKRGAARFPAVIACTQEAKTCMENDRDSGDGVYSPRYVKAGETPNNPHNDAMGLAWASKAESSGALWRAYIGREGDDIDEDDSPANEEYSKNPQSAYDVLLNPHGYYSSWVGGSVESFLEAAWAYENIVAKYRDSAKSLSTSYGNSAEAIVTKFYEEFYGSAPDVSKILSGGYAS